MSTHAPYNASCKTKNDWVEVANSARAELTTWILIGYKIGVKTIATMAIACEISHTFHGTDVVL
jgi:hypothetical protein